MAADKKVDLRIQRTKDSIRKTFEEMICEMDYEQISIKELAQRARINRKTFYLHYNTLDDLLREIQNEMAQNFIKRTQGLERPRDMDKITREFFLCSEELVKIGERITCSGNYKYISRKITNDIMNQTWYAFLITILTHPPDRPPLIPFISSTVIFRSRANLSNSTSCSDIKPQNPQKGLFSRISAVFHCINFLVAMFLYACLYFPNNYLKFLSLKNAPKPNFFIFISIPTNLFWLLPFYAFLLF